MEISPTHQSMNTLVGELERMRAMAQSESAGVAHTAGPDTGFSELMKQQLDSVNASQKHAASLAELFEVGNKDVSLVDVMIAGQKSRVAFTALVEVRNKMLSAYQEVMNMQV
ncbi:MAG: flagellar hook-basal body complex protein FliE [Pseudomonadota bacterium]